jgi:hypothetical protein
MFLYSKVEEARMRRTDVSEIDETEITLTLSRYEVQYLCGAIREMLVELGEWEFQTRTGESPEYAKKLFDKVITMVNKT